MNNFAEAMKNETRKTRTTNGAECYNTTNSALVDLFGSIGSLRGADETRIHSLFRSAYEEDALSATKILFYARDVRSGLGERETFRTLLRYCAFNYPEALRNNLEFIGTYGRYDDLYSLIHTPLEAEMWNAMKIQLMEDLHNMKQGKPISLLAKWIKTADASSKQTRDLGIRTALSLGYDVYTFKRMIRRMRKYLNVVEPKMSTNNWDKIEYREVPSKAMMNYRNAFIRHDTKRFDDYLSDVKAGKAKINSSTLYPYDIVRSYFNGDGSSDVLEEQWKHLPNYLEKEENVLVMCDTSGSMKFNNNALPLFAAIGLTLYFAERNVGAFHNLFLTFESDAHLMNIKGSDLRSKIDYISRAPWGGSTNIWAAFEDVLRIGINNHIADEDMPKALIIISDMQFDVCTGHGRTTSWGFYDKMKERFEECGYTIPDIVFWNVNSLKDTFHADANYKGVQMVSGCSAVTFKHVLDAIGYTPYECMMKIINNERYSQITIADK